MIRCYRDAAVEEANMQGDAANSDAAAEFIAGSVQYALTQFLDVPVVPSRAAEVSREANVSQKDRDSLKTA